MKTITKMKTLALITFLILSSTTAFTQQGHKTKLLIQSPSTLTLEGTSTLHDFKCTTTTIEGTVEMDSLKESFVNVEVTIPVKSIQSGKSSMDDNMYEALKADKFPSITFALSSSKNSQDTSAHGSRKMSVSGSLVIAGEKRTIEMPIEIAEVKKGITVKGMYTLLMSDYGIERPSFFLGTLKAGDKIVVRFDLQLRETGLQQPSSN